MKHVKITCTDGTNIEYDTEDTIDLQKAFEQPHIPRFISVSYRNKMIVLNLNNISFIELEK